MVRKTWMGAVVVASLLVTGCTATAADAPTTSAMPEPSHTMPDGSVMDGSDHGEHGSGAESAATDPSHAALMVCDGQVESAVASILQIEGDIAPAPSWDAPMFTCTYDIDGAPLVLSVHDATDPATGEQHFAETQASLGATEIEGMLGLGLPSFSTGDGMVGFLRDGKTLLVDATALPDSLAGGTMTPDEAAYAAASAVLVCWVEHD